MNEFEILHSVRNLIFSGRQLFWKNVQFIATERVKELDPESLKEALVAYPDAMLYLQPGDLMEAFQKTVDGIAEVNGQMEKVKREREVKNDSSENDTKKGGSNGVQH